MIIKVLGSGCPKCKKLEENVRKALEEKGIKAQVEKVTDITKIMNYGVMMTPGLVIDEKVVSVGKVLGPDKIVPLLK
ncbi:MAG: TM0996/MTH895 family glutaredoxin-like protein [Candidatus Cloacimonetes bacterium]|nr:TM0996/MTH895 family glutaredoxin-like protein [Candidatus Cloacimonadota bacterium]